MKRALPLALWLLSAASPALADTRYVSDELEVPVRSGKTLEHKILRMIPAGMAVEVLEIDPEGYTRVRAKAAEGWVLTRYLSERPSAREQLAALEAENASLQEQNRELKEGLSAASAESQELNRSTTALREENAGLRREMEALRHAAARPAEVAQENERLRQELAEVQSDLEGVRTRADVLGNAAYRQWFATGGGVAIAGLLLGLVLPRIYARRRRSSWDRL